MTDFFYHKPSVERARDELQVSRLVAQERSGECVLDDGSAAPLRVRRRGAPTDTRWRSSSRPLSGAERRLTPSFRVAGPTASSGSRCWASFFSVGIMERPVASVKVLKKVTDTCCRNNRYRTNVLTVQNVGNLVLFAWGRGQGVFQPRRLMILVVNPWPLLDRNVALRKRPVCN